MGLLDKLPEEDVGGTPNAVPLRIFKPQMDGDERR